MLYSLATLGARQRRYYSDLQEHAEEGSDVLAPTAASTGDPTVTVLKVLRVGSKLEYATQRAYLLPDPGTPPDLPRNADARRGFPSDLMELRLDWPPGASIQALSFTYPFSRGPVDIAPLLPRPTPSQPGLDSARAAVAGLLASGIAATRATLAFLREQPTDLWAGGDNRSQRLARFAPTGQPGAPVALGDAVAAAARIASQLQPNGLRTVPSYTTISLCEDAAAAHKSLLESRALGALHEQSTRKLGRENANDLLHAAALWALAGSPLRPERDPEQMFDAMNIRSVGERATWLFNKFQSRLLGEHMVAQALAVDPKQIPSDNVLDQLDLRVLELVTSEARLHVPVAGLEADLRRDAVTARRAVLTAGAYIVLGLESDAAQRLLERCESTSPDPVVRWLAKIIRYCKLGS